MIWWMMACGVPTETPEEEPPVPVQCEGDGEPSSLTIAPYVQLVTTDSVWVMWETDAGTESTVRFGPTDALGETACGTTVPIVEGAVGTTEVHEAELTGLTAATTYHYQVQTGELQSAIRHFRTAPANPDGSFQLVALGDSQQDSSHPEKFGEVIHDGVLPVVRERYGDDLAGSLAMVLFAGDLVDSGWIQTEWQEQFFAPAAELFSTVPIYPVPGNHEGNSPHYFRYFHLPEDEHHYTIDHGNLRVIGLDSNAGFRTQAQLEWLDDVLESTCDEPDIDFVFAQLHHPWLSELWNPGEEDWSGAVVERLGAFSTTCGKPSIHFYGHTHGYSRGSTQDHQHLMVNVSSAGGALDRWGEQIQADYPEFAVSQDEYGFVVVEVSGGDDPHFELLRFSRGTPENPLENVLTDRVAVRKANNAPARPTATADCTDALSATASAFSDPDGDEHQATHWQVAADCTGFDTLLVDRWRQRRNEYGGVDLQAGDDLTDEDFPEVVSGTACIRTRYRDDGLVWSDWSDGVPTSCAP